MRRKLLTVLTAFVLILVAAVSLAAVVYVVGRILSDLLGFCLFIWAITA